MVKDDYIRGTQKAEPLSSIPKVTKIAQTKKMNENQADK